MRAALVRQFDGSTKTWARIASRLIACPYFVVTEGLQERLLSLGGARIINTASAAHQSVTLELPKNPSDGARKPLVNTVNLNSQKS